MNITRKNPELVFQRVKKYEEKYNKHRFISKAHERSTLSYYDIQKNEMYEFRNDLDKRIYFMSHFLIRNSLELINYNYQTDYAKKILKKSAESLEFIYRFPQSESEISDEILLKSVFAYYISGNYANSFVLTDEIKENEFSIFLKLIILLLKKDFVEARYLTSRIFGNKKLKEKEILKRLEKGQISDDEAILRIICFSTARIVSLFIEHVKTGDKYLLEKAHFLLNATVDLSLEYHLVDIWWWLYCLSFILKEFDKNSFWNCLKDFENDNYSRLIVHKYIKNKLNDKPPRIELWPSQKDALTNVNDQKKLSFCLKMPTSSGKTQIAELTILKFLIDKDNSKKKCVYISPYKSLAVEIEKTFTKSLGSIGFKISELYGAFYINPVEKSVIEDSNVLIMTPEKFDAILRYLPELEDEIGLIIIDEVHNINKGNRGLMFEFFIQRLLNKYSHSNCRFVVISAVLPNAEDFAKWIANSQKQLKTSTWRSSRLLIGTLTWDTDPINNNKKIEIIYTHERNDNKLKKIKPTWKIPNFIVKTNYKGIEGLRKYPKTSREGFAYASLLLAIKDITLIFIPPKKHLIEFADFLNDEVFPDLIKIYKSQNQDFGLPIVKNNEYYQCRDTIIAEMGKDSPLLSYLEKGFIIHHASLPDNVRIVIEDLVRSGAINLIISTSTLAEGVNLPIKNILVKEYYYRYYPKLQPIDSFTFWNVCGRAGRAGKENEGNVLFWLDKETPSKNNINLIKQLLDEFDRGFILSQIYEKLGYLAMEWKINYPNVKFSEACEYIAENVYESNQEDLSKDIDIIDGHILALIEEAPDNLSLPEFLQEFLKNSLLFIQLDRIKESYLTKSDIIEFFSARSNLIESKYRKNVRKRFYQLGMRLSDCEIIENNSTKLIKLFNVSKNWFELSDDLKIEIILNLSEIILELKGLVETQDIPPIWREILYSWLKGRDVSNIITEKDVNNSYSSQNELKLFLDNFCGNILPWGLNSVFNYLKYLDDEILLIPSYFSGMLKYGVLNPVALWIIPNVNKNRKFAKKLSNICPYGINEINKLYNWLNSLSMHYLIQYGFSEEDATKIIEYISNSKINTKKENLNWKVNIPINSDLFTRITPMDKVVVVPKDKQTFSVFTVDGVIIGSFSLEIELPNIWYQLNRSNAYVSTIQKKDDGNYSIQIVLDF